MSKQDVQEALKKFVATEMIENVGKIVEDPALFTLILKGESITLNMQIRVPEETVLKMKELL